jgi:predicted AlkP superfamily phosphohydrolase/phosphomutase
MTPIQIDPEHPAMPISHPAHYAIALAKLQGPFATLGLAEDTWALNERVIDEQAFLDQTWAIHDEREWQFFHALDHQPEGLVATVFDATDRIQHMFFRFLDPDHPANRGRDIEPYRNTIEDLYRRADDLVGRTLQKLRKDDVLFILSDHGFKTFQRGVNLNSWFRDNGYLFLDGDPEGEPLPLPAGSRIEPAEIDWSRTRAYANGLAGFYLNIKGRERNGLVDPADVPALKQEIMSGLRELIDEQRGEKAINEVYDSREAYTGPYRENAPDVIVGYAIGYRADWDAAVGRITDQVFADNTRAWSGDHCIDPQLVPGILFANIPFQKDDPGLIDLAPSILELFGIQIPAHMTGGSVFQVAGVPEKESA